MGSMLDTLGSIAIGGLVVLILITVTLQFTERTSNTRVSEITNFTINETGQIIERDFSKLGYRTDGNPPIVSFDSTHISFFGDLENDGEPENIIYSLKKSKNETLLIREVLTDEGVKISDWSTPIKELIIICYDKNNKITKEPNLVKSIEFSFTLTSKETDATTDIGAYWNKRMFPRNL